ncbi:PREDICTED: luciferin 4-monooxygenase-like [Nicrophorus vespilloides]|uniref:Luciferin 4-monooxygenase-like n=1 Tax=Nicrophorus vespilloides TaxID=110193 RepID=A0ABM1MMI5_NICVS|nr:PREDICTED: luciferin 4-monooxygenase-like [Nicrophorus vespilloides]
MEGLIYDDDSKIITVPEKPPHIHEKGLGVMVFETMKINSDQIAQVNMLTGESEDYDSLLKRCTIMAVSMRGLDLKEGDMISICSENTIDCAVPWVAALFQNVKISSLDPSLSVEECEHLLEMVESKVVYVSRASTKLIEEVVEKMEKKPKIVTIPERNDDIYKKETTFAFEPVAVDLKETAVVLFSSGTTGFPKGICWSHKFLIYFCQHRIFNSCLGYATMYWASTVFNMVCCLLTGSTKYFAPHVFNPIAMWNYLKIYTIDYVFLSPYDAINFIKNKPNADFVPKVQFMAIAGSSISTAYIKKLKEILPKTLVVNAYGQTELMSIFSPFHKWNKTKPDSIGIPISGRTYKIVDTETEKALGFNEAGEIRVKTEWVMNGYFNLDSSSSWDSEGFLKTGDIGYYDKDFCFFFVDRIKEMFKYKSWHIVPAKIEAILNKHPSIHLSVVIGVPHPEDDNHTLALVQLYEGEHLEEKDVIEYIEDNMDERHKLNAGVKFVTKFPYTPTSKINRRKLRETTLKDLSCY